MVAQRRTVPGLHTPWPLEDHHVDRRLAPLRPGGPDAPRRADAWGCLQGLCGTGPGTRTRPRRHRRHGQPARPQGRWGIRQAIEAAGATLLYLPPYSPDCNPIEMAFSKLKALLRKAAARTVDDLWDAIADAIDAFTSTECENYFAAAGYDRD